MIEIIEFPQLAVKYNVSGVPKTVLNEDIQIEGAAPESMLMQWIESNVR
jgi:predicted DsbA family dithiol-disulfide isomerase